MSAEKLVTIKMLKDARYKVISRAVAAEKAGNIEEKVRWEQRRIVLDEELSKIQVLDGNIPSKRVFISYSVKSGQAYFQYLQKILSEANFEVVDGFKATRGTEGNILKIVLKQLRESTLYIAVLSKEIRVQDGRQTRWSPGVWVSEEKGMALALEKPFLLLIHEDIHRDFYMKTAPHKYHVFFNESNFNERAQVIVEQANDRYDEYILKYASRLHG